MNYEKLTESEGDMSCPALLQAAHPEIYWRNAFRVVGLSVEATPREILQHTQKLQMMRKYNPTAISNIPLALDPPPDEYTIQEAVHKLQDPEKRLIDEFFWFWPRQLGQSKTDKALAYLTANDIDRAAEYWHQMEQSSEAYVSMHNLAVLFHCLALDLEQVGLRRKLSTEEFNTLQKYWDYAFKRWKIVLNHEPFWSRLTARIRALKDPRLTTGLARRIRASLPLALLSINAALAVRYAEVGNLKEAERQLKIIKLWDASGEGKKIQRKALSQACEPIRQRIKIICKNAESQANKDPSHGYKTAMELIEQTKSPLAILNVLLGQGDAMRDTAHDEVAVCVLHCQVLYANKTEDWKGSLELLKLALPIATGQAARDRIQQNIDIVESNLLYGTCWFCQQNPAEDEAVVEVKMYGDVKQIPTWQGMQIKWRHGTVKVPRCAQCKSAHNRKDACMAVGGVLGGILGGFLGYILAGDEVIFGSTIVGVGLGLFVGMGIGAAIGKLPTGVKPKSAMSEFPSVKQLLSSGWKFGDRPTEEGD